MKTKLTFLSIAIAALLGVGMLMAFKQEDKPRKYLLMKVVYIHGFTKPNAHIIVLEGSTVLSDDVIKDEDDPKYNIHIQTAQKINDISGKGFKLISQSTRTATEGDYIFEKE